MRVLITEPLVAEAVELLRSEHEVSVRQGISPAELHDIIGEYDALVVRSHTQVTGELIRAAHSLKLIARAGIGVDNIDVDEATRRGIMIINVPNGNVVAVAEHTLALALALARHIPAADAAVRHGKWARSAFEGIELFEKTFGIVGLGHIGSEVAHRAQALGMTVIAADPLVAPEFAAELGVRLVSLPDLLRTADFITLHVPALPSTRSLIGRTELALVKPGAYIINCARGGIVDEDALLEALEGERLAGAALDVFESEPPASDRLLGNSRLVLTPHIGGSTVEARTKIGVEVAREVLRVAKGQQPIHPVNMPSLSPREWSVLTPYLDLAQRLAVVGNALITGQLQAVTVESRGADIGRALELVTNAALQGLLTQGGERLINLVSARSAARARGLVLHESRVDSEEDGENVVLVRLETTDGDVDLLGSVTRGVPHVLRVNGHWLEFPLHGRLLFSEHREGPGIIGEVGKILGDEGVSISFIQLGRTGRGGRGLMVLGLDDSLPPTTLEGLSSLPSVVWIRLAILPVNGWPDS